MSDSSFRAITYRSSVKRNVLFLALSVILMLAGVFTLEDGTLLELGGVALFGLFACTFLLQLIPGASCLKLTREGFEVRTLFRTSFTAWKDVAHFQAGVIGLRSMVFYDYTPEAGKTSFSTALSKAVAPGEVGIPENYGHTAEQLAGILNEWKRASMLSSRTATHTAKSHF